jgi:hypothetical protein
MSPLAIEVQAKELADAGAWEKLTEFLLPHVGPQSRPRTILYAAMAFSETKSARLLDDILKHAVGANLPQHIAVAIGRTLALAGEATAAWSVLLTNNGLGVPEKDVPALARVLALIVQFATDRNLRIAADTLRRRVTGAAAPVKPDQVIVWGTEHAPVDLQASNNAAALLNRDAAQPGVLSELEIVQSKWEDSLSRDVRPQVTVYNNVLVNRLGQVWRDNGDFILTCNRTLPSESIAAGKTAASTQRGIMAMEDGGIYHWMCEWLPSLFWGAYQDENCPDFLMSDRAPTYQTASLDLLTSHGARVSVGDAVRVERLHVVDRRLHNFRYWSAYEDGFRRINEAALAAAPHQKPIDLYISRRDTNKRPMKNELELTERLEGMGFNSVSLSGMGMAEQVALFARARNIIAPHGAGLSHLLAKRGKAKILELFPLSAGSMSLRYNFARISRLRQHDHALYLDRINPITNEWAVDVEKVVQEVGRIFGR